MANETHINSTNGPQRDVVVNSNSLEDVALSEISDNRAQSIQSLHSNETPTPDNTPSFEEIEQHLEASTRNIQSMTEQKQKLMQMHEQALQHLKEMEAFRGQAKPISSALQNGNGDEAPDYKSMAQLNTDTEALVTRMKQITALIQKQNQLGEALGSGDENAEILQDVYQERDKMHSILADLQLMNREAQQAEQNVREREAKANCSTSKGSAYERQVPLQLLDPPRAEPQGNYAEENPNADSPDAENLRQKNEYIKDMQAHLQRLNDMYQAINLIEQHANDARRASSERERTPVAQNYANATGLTKMRLLEGDIESQARHVQLERDRILALKAQIARCESQAAAAKQLGEEALKRNSLTPTPSHVERELAASATHGTDIEAKQQKLQRLFKEIRTLSYEIMPRPEIETDTEDEQHDNDGPKAGINMQPGLYGTANAKAHKMPKAAAYKTTKSDRNAFEAASQQSCSSAGSFMPPAMKPLGNNEHWPHSSTAAQSTPAGCSSLPSSLYASSLPTTASFTPMHFASQSFSTPPLLQNNMGSSVAGATDWQQRHNSAHSAQTASSTASSQFDPLILQQFSQTQQILIQSVQQCNQMLWRQQAEIDNLNNLVQSLQIRLHAGAAAAANLNTRAESAPPPSPFAALNTDALQRNNAVLLQNLQWRAQSEQRVAGAENFVLPPNIRGNACMSCPSNTTSTNYQPQHLSEQPHNYNNNASNIERAAQQPPPSHNAAADDAAAPLSPGAITSGCLLVHHNNNLQNNANLAMQARMQANQRAPAAFNLQPQQQAQHYNRNLSNNVSGNMLNNQVPPGNRANNYWDNFRSYSRQNLLSTNSNKSNEDQYQQQLQQQQAALQKEYAEKLQQLHQELRTQAQMQQQQQQQQQRQQHVEKHQQPQPQQQQPAAAAAENLNDFWPLNLPSGTRRNPAADNVTAGNINLDNLNIESLRNSALNLHNAVTNFGGDVSNLRSNVANFGKDTREMLGACTGGSNFHAADNLWQEPNFSSEDNYNMNLNFGNSAQHQRSKVPQKNTTAGYAENDNDSYSLPTPPQAGPQAGSMSALSNMLAEQDKHLSLVNTMQQRKMASKPTAASTNDSHALDLASCSNRTSFAGNNTSDEGEPEQHRELNEELRRNLLENAQKNDKFNCKYYESLKDDFLRRLETLMVEKKTLLDNPSDVEQCYRQSMQKVLGKSAAEPEDTGRETARNKRLSNQQQSKEQQRRRSLAHAQAQRRSAEPVPHVPLLQTRMYREHFKPRNGPEPRLPPGTVLTPGNIDLAMPDLLAADLAESGLVPDLEIEDNVLRSWNTLKRTQTLPALDLTNSTQPAHLQKRTNHQRLNWLQFYGPIPASATFLNRRQLEENEATSKLPVKPALQGNTINLRNLERSLQEGRAYEYIDYIIDRIRNQTQPHSTINDTLIGYVAKLTATVAQNLSAARDNSENANRPKNYYTPPLNVAPKKIFNKIKKLRHPHDRDEFLIWYRAYLEAFLDISPRPLSAEPPLEEPCREPQAAQAVAQAQPATEREVNHADLAEADQLAANNSVERNDANLDLIRNAVATPDAGARTRSQLNEQVEQQEQEEGAVGGAAVAVDAMQAAAVAEVKEGNSSSSSSCDIVAATQKDAHNNNNN